MENSELILTETLYGPMVVRRKDGFVGKSLFKMGEYSPVERDFYLALAKPGEVIMNIGANIGSIAIPLAKAGHKVYAFEPEETNFNLLLANCTLTQAFNVRPYKAAMGNENGLCSMNTQEKLNPGATFMEHTDNDNIPMSTVDTFTEQIGSSDIIIADAEGSEPLILEGARKTIKEHDPIVIVEADKKQVWQDTIKLAKELFDNQRWLITFLDNQPNFKQCTENLWDCTASFNLVCFNDSKKDRTVLEGLPQLDVVKEAGNVNSEYIISGIKEDNGS